MIQILSSQDCDQALRQFAHPAQKSYLAFYSSVLGGITRDPRYMSVPVDDHLVHRGDGVFEALKCKNKNIYLWQGHLQRLQKSAEGLALNIPNNLEAIVRTTVQAAREDNCIIRIFLSRGPGYFTTNPYDSIGSQLYVMVTSLSELPSKKYEQGVAIGRSLIPAKEAWLAQLKTCNYLPNVMMKKEAIDRQLDFTVGFDSKGQLTEGSTENIMLVSQDGTLVRPRYPQILRGTTMMRSFELAEKLVAEGKLKSLVEANLREEDLLSAQEVMMVGTTLDVVPVVNYEGRPIGTGKVGPVSLALLAAIRSDQLSGADILRV